MSQAGSEPGPDEGTSIDGMADLDHQIAGLPDVVRLLSQAIGPLGNRLDRLVESDAAGREDLALVTEVLAGLTQLAEVGDQHLGDLAAGQEAMLGRQRALVTGVIGELSRSLTTDVRQLASRLAELVARTAVLDDVQQALAGTREAVTDLSTRTDRAQAAGRDAADAQALALAGVTATADGLATSLGSLRLSLTAAMDTAGQATVAAIDDRLGSQLADTAARLEADVGAKLNAHLGDLGISQLRVSVAELVQQAVEARSEDRALCDAVQGLDDRLGDLGAALSQSLDEAMHLVAQQLERQADATMEVWTYLAKQPSEAERTDDLRHEVGRATAGLQATMERMAIEVAATRDAIERRASSRWRRGDDDDDGSTNRELAFQAPSALEQRVDRALSALDKRLGSLAGVVTTRPRPSTRAPSVAPTPKGPVKKAVVKKTAVKKGPVKKTAVKKSAVKKSAVKKAPGSTRRSPS